MSVSAATTIRRFPRWRRSPTREPLRVRILEWGVGVPVVVWLLISVVGDWPTAKAQLPQLVGWLGVVAVTDLLPVRLWSSVVLTMSLPVLLAAGMVYEPHVVGALALLGSTDPREWRREVSVGRALHNRAQVALSVAAASMVFNWLDGDPRNWPAALAIGLAALATDFVVNAMMVAAPLRVLTGLSLRTVLRRIHGDDPVGHAIGYVCLGITAIVLSTLFSFIGVWALLAFVAPLALGRQMFSQARRASAAMRALRIRDRSLRAVARSITAERRDERLSVAADLHDEVLQPLYKVHLMGQVLRRDLETGRLLQLDEDLPELLHAAEVAQESIQGILRNLKRSSLGPGGLTTTLGLLVRHLESETSIAIEVHAGEVGGSPLSQLIVYQVAKEAIINAIRHSRASRILVEIGREDSNLALSVIDDGVGFAPELVDEDTHFGIGFMRARVESTGGRLSIVSSRGGGTKVRALVPMEAS